MLLMNAAAHRMDARPRSSIFTFPEKFLHLYMRIKTHIRVGDAIGDLPRPSKNPALANKVVQRLAVAPIESAH